MQNETNKNKKMSAAEAAERVKKIRCSSRLLDEQINDLFVTWQTLPINIVDGMISALTREEDDCASC